MDIDWGDFKSLLSIGRGMRDIAQVDSKGCPRKLFLCNMIT